MACRTLVQFRKTPRNLRDDTVIDLTIEYGVISVSIMYDKY